MAESPAANCARFHEVAQVERLDGRLQEAREALLACSREDCPTFVSADCVQWLEEVQAEIPTLVFEALGDDGLITDVEVRLGERVLTQSLDGRPIEVPVGLSEFVFTRASGERKVLRVLLRSGETNRIVSADFRTPQAAPAAALPEASAIPAPELVALRPIPTPVWLFGAGTLLATATGITMGSIAKAKESDAGGACAPNCSDAVVSEIKAFALAADVSFGVAIAAGITTTILYLSRPTVSVPRTAPVGSRSPHDKSMTIAPMFMAGPGTAWFGVRGRLQ